MAIFPEGTIPGEEDVPRRAVDPQTGLLPGSHRRRRGSRSSGRADHPGRRLGNRTRLPAGDLPAARGAADARSRRRSGSASASRSILDEYRDRKEDRELFREITEDVMHSISALVDHRSNYVPIEVPIPAAADVTRRSACCCSTASPRTSTPSTGWSRTSRAPASPTRCRCCEATARAIRTCKGVTARDWYVDAERR